MAETRQQEITRLCLELAQEVDQNEGTEAYQRNAAKLERLTRLVAQDEIEKATEAF